MDTKRQLNACASSSSSSPGRIQPTTNPFTACPHGLSSFRRLMSILYLLSLLSLVRGMCSDPGVPTDGYLLSQNVTFPVSDTEEVEFACNYGYMLLGNDTLVCESGGTWSSSLPQCTGIMSGASTAPGPRSTPYGAMLSTATGHEETTAAEVSSVAINAFIIAGTQASATVGGSPPSKDELSSDDGSVDALRVFLYVVLAAFLTILAAYMVVLATKAVNKRISRTEPDPEDAPLNGLPMSAWAADSGAQPQNADAERGNRPKGRHTTYRALSATGRENIQYVEGNFYLDSRPGEPIMNSEDYIEELTNMRVM
ncbi:uncharacterized protein [Ptychodera flava]|uniref:uncharacterized protein isoform X2 n=1 Tax=Ptychodera flava TaxID=63121 RepID=UPI00396A6D13